MLAFKGPYLFETKFRIAQKDLTPNSHEAILLPVILRVSTLGSSVSLAGLKLKGVAGGSHSLQPGEAGAGWEESTAGSWSRCVTDHSCGSSFYHHPYAEGLPQILAVFKHVLKIFCISSFPQQRG